VNHAYAGIPDGTNQRSTTRIRIFINLTGLLPFARCNYDNRLHSKNKRKLRSKLLRTNVLKPFSSL